MPKFHVSYTVDIIDDPDMGDYRDFGSFDYSGEIDSPEIIGLMKEHVRQGYKEAGFTLRERVDQSNKVVNTGVCILGWSKYEDEYQSGVIPA